MATTGIAEDLLQDGRTMHSCTKLPVPLTETSVSRLLSNTPESDKNLQASLLLIDEVSMVSKYALDSIDEVLRRLCKSTDIFGGKVLLLGGDFRQTTTIVLKGTPVEVIENSVISAFLRRHANIIRLNTNMRSFEQLEFNKWLFSIGEGKNSNIHINVTIPQEYIEVNDLVDSIYGRVIIKPFDNSIVGKIILTSKNEHANVINGRVLSLLAGQSKLYRSADNIVSDDVDEHLRYPLEFLNKQQPSRMPPHHLELEIGAIVMLL